MSITAPFKSRRVPAPLAVARRAVVAAVLCATASCGPPRIDRFSVAPTRVCAGRQVTVSWSSANGYPTLTVQPSGFPAQRGAVAATGSLPYGIFKPTNFTLQVGTGSSAVQQTQSATLATGGASSDATYPGRCASSETVAMDLNVPADVPGMLVNSIVASRPMTVTHAGRTVSITAGALVSRALDRTPYEGSYHLEVPALPQERCGAVSEGAFAASLRVFGSCPEDLIGDAPPSTPPGGVGAPSSGITPCGGMEQVCCGIDCNDGLVCQGLAVCRPPGAANPTCSGATATSSARVYAVGFLDPWDCVAGDTTVSPYANSLEEALQCATSAAPAGARPALLPDVSDAYKRMGSLGCDTVYPKTLQGGDLDRCAQHLFCPDGSCTVERGSCP